MTRREDRVELKRLATDLYRLRFRGQHMTLDARALQDLYRALARRLPLIELDIRKDRDT
jgi:hypothetical protein